MSKILSKYIQEDMCNVLKGDADSHLSRSLWDDSQ